MKFKLTITTLILLTSLNLLGQTDSKTTLEIKGYGRIKTLPDIGIINIEINTIKDQFGKTINDLNEKTDRVQKQLEKIGFKKESIKTTNFRVQANRIYNQGKSYDSGYVGTQTVVAEFENKKETIAKIINSFTESSTGFQFNFSFGLSDAKREELRNQIIKLAVNDANAIAKLITETSNRQIDKMIEIKYGTFDNLFSSGGLFEEVAVGYGVNRASSVGFEVKELSFTDYVIIKWTLK